MSGESPAPARERPAPQPERTSRVNPLHVHATRKAEEIRLLFQPPQPQAEFPVAAAVFRVGEGRILEFDDVRLRIPAWGIDAAVVEEGRATTIRQFWYRNTQPRPGDEEAEIEVTGYRKGTKPEVLYRGRVTAEKDRPFAH